MSDYTKSTNFASKDSLSIGNPLKIVKGTEIDTEFNNIATAVATKADIVSPTFTGTPLAPTATAGTNTTQLATTAFVAAAVTAYDTALTVSTSQIENAAVTPAKLSTGAPTWDTSGNTDIGNNVTVAGSVTMSESASRFTQINDSSVAVTEIGVGVLTGFGDSVGLANKTTTGSLSLGTNSVERVRIDNTGAQSSVIPGGSTLYPEYKCRAWVNFDGTGTTGTNQTIRASGNVTSVYKNGTGDYTVTLTTALPDANYSTSITASASSGTARYGHTSDVTTPTSSTYRFVVSLPGVGVGDSARISVAFMR